MQKRKASFDHFKDLLGDIPLIRVLEGKGAQGRWLIFKHRFFEAHDFCIIESKKSCKGGRKPARMSKDLMEKYKWKKKVYTM